LPDAESSLKSVTLSIDDIEEVKSRKWSPSSEDYTNGIETDFDKEMNSAFGDDDAWDTGAWDMADAGIAEPVQFDSTAPSDTRHAF